jgi:predicted nucleic acid-binding protein
MIRALLDTNVILDALLAREPSGAQVTEKTGISL